MASPEIVGFSKQQSKIRNFSIIAHVDHGKTTFADNLLYAAGALSGEMVGRALQLDDKPDEIERGITIDSSFSSFVYENHLLHFVDTPGHLDFEHEVSSALRLVEGAIVLVCAVEGIMPQTELVLRKSVYEDVKPILFINKLDLLLDRDPKEIQQRISDIILQFNGLLKDLGSQYSVSLHDGTVLFGSAKDAWAVSYPFMLKHKVTIADIKKNYSLQWLNEHCPLHSVVLAQIIETSPMPNLTRLKKIAENIHGTTFFVSKVEVCDEGYVATGRVFSGELAKGVYHTKKGDVNISSLEFCNHLGNSLARSIPEGNICSIICSDATVGDVFFTDVIPKFKPLAQHLGAMIRKSVEPVHFADFEKLRLALSIMQHKDPFFTFSTDQITGELFVSGFGELHVDVLLNRIIAEFNILLTISKPLLIYKKVKDVLLEPVQQILMLVPHELIGDVTQILGSHKAQIGDVVHEDRFTRIVAKMPLEQYFGFPTLFMSTVHGNGALSVAAVEYVKVPAHKMPDVEEKIAKRQAIVE